jgi:hypothetical protein
MKGLDQLKNPMTSLGIESRASTMLLHARNKEKL